jgi:preprotein translocase subunit YajC
VRAIFFGLVQFAVLLAIYRAILRRERAQQEKHEQHQKDVAGQDA